MVVGPAGRTFAANVFHVRVEAVGSLAGTAVDGDGRIGSPTAHEVLGKARGTAYAGIARTGRTRKGVGRTAGTGSCAAEIATASVPFGNVSEGPTDAKRHALTASAYLASPALVGSLDGTVEVIGRHGLRPITPVA